MDPTGSITSLQFDSKGRTLISVSSANVVTRWEAANGQTIEIPLGLPDFVPSLALGPGGGILATGNRDDTVSLWDLATTQRIGQPLGQRAIDDFFYTMNVAFSADSRLLASVHCIEKDEIGLMCAHLKIVLWDIASRQPLGLPFTWKTGYIRSLFFNPQGTSLISSTYEGTLLQWDLDPQSWIGRACDIVRRNFTQDEWKQYFSTEPYRLTCPQWPVGS